MIDIYTIKACSHKTYFHNPYGRDHYLLYFRKYGNLVYRYLRLILGKDIYHYCVGDGCWHFHPLMNVDDLIYNSLCKRFGKKQVIIK